MADELLRITHKGKLEFGESIIPCGVLEDGTRVLSETGIANAILRSRSGASIRRKTSKSDGAHLPVFLASESLKPFISNDLEAGAHVIRYLDGKRETNGYDANILPLICDVWLNAREAGVLKPSQQAKAQNAEILMRSLAKVGIIALVDEATGYQEVREKDALQKLLSIYLSGERLKWAKMFPDEYYKQLFRLKGWSYNPIDVRRPKFVGKLTNELVYEKLPPGVLDELKKLNPVKNKKTGRREAAHHQHLSEDIGQQDLRDHLLQLIAIMRISPNWSTFKKHFSKAFPTIGDQLELDIEEQE